MADRNAWADYEATIAPPADAAARVRARLDRTLATRGQTIEGDRAQASKAAAAILVLKSSAISVTIAVATLAGLHVGARAITAPAEPPAMLAPSRVEPESSSPATPIAIAPAGSVAPTTTTIVAPEPAPPREPVIAPRRSAPEAPRADRLAAELALVDPARAALARGDHANALRLFAEHAQRFPNGALAPERDAYSAIARCQDGARDRKALLAAFARAHVGSSLLDRVREACRDSSTDSPPPSEMKGE